MCLYYQWSQDELYFLTFTPRHTISSKSVSAITECCQKTLKKTTFKWFDPEVLFTDANTNQPQSDSVHVQTHHSRACGQCYRGIDLWPQRPLVKAEVILVVGPQALGAVLSQDLDGEARCNQALWGLLQLHVEVLPQATHQEMDCFAAAIGVWWACIWVQGPPPPLPLVVGNFMRDVNALVVDLIGRYNFIF